VKNVIPTALKSLGIGYILYLCNQWFNTDFLKDFLKENLLTILFALLAINGATLSVVLTKLRDLVDANKSELNFSRTRSEIVLSIKEQVVLIPVSLVLLMSQESVFVANNPLLSMTCFILLAACLAYALFVLYDTTMSIFVLLDH
jgi:hypothetical protein